MLVAQPFESPGPGVVDLDAGAPKQRLDVGRVAQVDAASEVGAEVNQDVLVALGCQARLVGRVSWTPADRCSDDVLGDRDIDREAVVFEFGRKQCSDRLRPSRRWRRGPILDRGELC